MSGLGLSAGYSSFGISQQKQDQLFKKIKRIARLKLRKTKQKFREITNLFPVNPSEDACFPALLEVLGMGPIAGSYK